MSQEWFVSALTLAGALARGAAHLLCLPYYWPIGTSAYFAAPPVWLHFLDMACPPFPANRVEAAVHATLAWASLSAIGGLVCMRGAMPVCIARVCATCACLSAQVATAYQYFFCIINKCNTCLRIAL